MTTIDTAPAAAMSLAPADVYRPIPASLLAAPDGAPAPDSATVAADSDRAMRIARALASGAYNVRDAVRVSYDADAGVLTCAIHGATAIGTPATVAWDAPAGITDDGCTTFHGKPGRHAALHVGPVFPYVHPRTGKLRHVHAVYWVPSSHRPLCHPCDIVGIALYELRREANGGQRLQPDRAYAAPGSRTGRAARHADPLALAIGDTLTMIDAMPATAGPDASRVVIAGAVETLAAAVNGGTAVVPDGHPAVVALRTLADAPTAARGHAARMAAIAAARDALVG